MSRTQDELMDAFAGELCSCYQSTAGCTRMPVRMVAEMAQDEAHAVNLVMLCIDHAKTYTPVNPIWDRIIGDDVVEFYAKHNL